MNGYVPFSKHCTDSNDKLNQQLKDDRGASLKPKPVEDLDNLIPRVVASTTTLLMIVSVQWKAGQKGDLQ